MYVALTGATGFIGRYILRHLVSRGDRCRCWYRPTSDRSGLEDLADAVEWVEGHLGGPVDPLVEDVEAVVHAALYHPGGGFRGSEGELSEFLRINLLGSLELMEGARRAGVRRFVFLSTCAVHEIILDDRPLDEAHPLWPTTHYGAHKAAIEKFVHSYGFGQGWEVCALRPTGVYGVAHPVQDSKWFRLIRRVKAGQRIETDRGGKEVHAADVARAVGILLEADGVAGQAYNCYDMYVSEAHVARIARDLCGSDAEIIDRNRGPKHQIETGKIRALGMTFGGEALLRETIARLVEAA